MQKLFLFLSACVLQSYSAEWRWQGKVAVVTGASSGIGAEIAVVLADKGMIVVGLARREERITALSTRTKGKIHAIKCDLTKEDEIIKAFKDIENNYGGVDVLVNNAGIYRMASLITGESGDWRDILDLNVVSLSMCTKEALKTMRKRGDNGHIINMNSVVGHQVPEFDGIPFGIYTASKYAVTAISETLRVELRELGSKIRITSISPSIVVTELITNLTLETLDLLTKKELEVPMPTFIYAEDIAEAIVYALGTRPIVQVKEITIQGVGYTNCGK